MSDKEIQEILLRYRQGKCSADEIMKIHLWYESLNKDFPFSLELGDKIFLEEKILNNIFRDDDEPSLRIYTKVSVSKVVWWKSSLLKFGIAASVLLTMGLLYFISKNADHVTLKSESLVKHSREGRLRSSENNSKIIRRIKLEDNSIVTLSPGSRLSYPNVFSADKREVQLEGDAFFEISKNPEKPFFVYSGKLVTRVLGTSFRIKSDVIADMTEIEVVTGKVSVFENHFLRKRQDKKMQKRSQGVVLTPNQRVSYYEESGHLLTGIVEEPVLIPANNRTSSFVFDNESLSDITARLQKEYGIEIVFDNELLEKCTFTGDITDIPLYDKLDLICKANTAFYEVKGTRILISGNGCTN